MFNVLLCWPALPTLPSKSNHTIGYSVMWTRFLGSWKSWFFNFLNCQNRRERENILTHLIPEHQYEQNLEPSSRMTCSHSCSQDLTAGNPRLPGYHCEEMAWRTPGSLFKCCDVSTKKTSYGLGWTRKHPNTQKRTWSKLIFLYCSTLLLNNPISYLHLSFVHLLSLTNSIM